MREFFVKSPCFVVVVFVSLILRALVRLFHEQAAHMEKSHGEVLPFSSFSFHAPDFSEAVRENEMRPRCCET